MDRFAKFLVILLAIALAIPAGFGGNADVLAKKKGTIKTKTFANTEFVSIWAGAAGGASVYPSEIRVRGFKKGKVKDVNVHLGNLTHSRPDDVDIMLVAPDGRRAVVLADAGGNSYVGFVDLTLDDEAAQHPPSAGIIASGMYAPVNYTGADPFTGAPAPSGDMALSTFDGARVNGSWRLYIFDDTDDEGGSLQHGWSLTITAKGKDKNKNKKKHT
jgi:subtilisin-like proprotein convertase family protein